MDTDKANMRIRNLYDRLFNLVENEFRTNYGNTNTWDNKIKQIFEEFKDVNTYLILNENFIRYYNAFQAHYIQNLFNFKKEDVFKDKVGFQIRNILDQYEDYKLAA